MHLRGLSDDVYCQIGLVMLIGLSAKNSILIVEFAEQLRRKGRSLADAAAEAGELRLRPILMTSFAFILGVMPLVFATGAGALGRRSVGTTIVGGMLLSTVLNLFFIPTLYFILSNLLGTGAARSSTPWSTPPPIRSSYVAPASRPAVAWASGPRDHSPITPVLMRLVRYFFSRCAIT